MDNKRNKGFSLVELIVVILIISILAIGIAPSVMKYVGQAKINTITSNVAAIERTISVVQAENGITDLNEFMYTPLRSDLTASIYKDFANQLISAIGEDVIKDYTIGVSQDTTNHTRYVSIRYYPDGVSANGHYYYFENGAFAYEYN